MVHFSYIEINSKEKVMRRKCKHYYVALALNSSLPPTPSKSKKLLESYKRNYNII